MRLVLIQPCHVSRTLFSDRLPRLVIFSPEKVSKADGKKCDNENIFRYGYLMMLLTPVIFPCLKRNSSLLIPSFSKVCHVCFEPLLLIQASKNNGYVYQSRSPSKSTPAPQNLLAFHSDSHLNFLCFTWQHGEIHRFLFAR